MASHRLLGLQQSALFSSGDVISGEGMPFIHAGYGISINESLSTETVKLKMLEWQAIGYSECIKVGTLLGRCQSECIKVGCSPREMSIRVH